MGALGPYDMPSPLPPDVEASVRAMMVERPPWEAEIPVERLATAPFPKLVVSGAHNAAFDAVCDALEEAPLGGSVLSCRARVTRSPGRLDSPNASKNSSLRRSAVLDQELAQPRVSLLVGGHQRREVVLLASVRVRPVLEEERRQLVARAGVLLARPRCGAVPL